MCHPANFRPSWFHARDYGLLLANPFGRKAFGKGDASKVVVKRGGTLRLRYGVLLHARPEGSLRRLPPTGRQMSGLDPVDGTGTASDQSGRRGPGTSVPGESSADEDWGEGRRRSGPARPASTEGRFVRPIYFAPPDCRNLLVVIHNARQPILA